MSSAMPMDAPGFVSTTGPTDTLIAGECMPPTRLSAIAIHDLLHADDCALDSTTEENMERSMDLFASGCSHFKVAINTEKKVIMHQQPPTT
ncbi:hypothetical protein SprV_0301336600 [Sparganum proliferum]